MREEKPWNGKPKQNADLSEQCRMGRDGVSEFVFSVADARGLCVG